MKRSMTSMTALAVLLATGTSARYGERQAVAYDKIKVQVYRTDDTLFKILPAYSNLNTNRGYTAHTANLSSYIGKTVALKFSTTEDKYLYTMFVLNDATVTVR